MKKALSITIRWLVAGGILFYLFHYKIDPVKLWETIRGAQWWWVTAAVATYGVTFLIGALRWHCLLHSQEIRIPLQRVVLICFVGQFFNSFMLGGTGGDLIKAYYASHQTKTHKPEAVTSVFVDRLVGLFGLFTVVIVMLGLNFALLREHSTLRWLASVAGWIIGIMVIVIPLSLWAGRTPRLKWLKDRTEKLPVFEHLRRAVRSYRNYGKHRRVLMQAWGFSLALHCSHFLGVAFLGKGLGITGVGWNEYFLLVPLINTFASLPITVAGFGVREELYRRAFGEFGVAAEMAVALGLCNYCVQLVWSLAGGLVYLLWKPDPAMLQQARHELADSKT